MRHILAADIGGTNSRFGHFLLEEGSAPVLHKVVWVKTAETTSFPELLQQLMLSDLFPALSEAAITVFAVAGPIEEGCRSRPPFIPWEIDLSALNEFGFRNAVLINDFVAQAYACISPLAETAEVVLPGKPVAGAPVAVIGAGTGLGKALIIEDSRGFHIALPSEGGHTNFPFVTEREYAFQKFLMKERRGSYITANTVVSGGGLSSLHHFLTSRKLDPFDVASEFAQYPETLTWAARFYGRVCRNYLLETLALGGLYIAGGVAARTPELLRHQAFAGEFLSSDTMRHLLEHVPVSLMTDQNSGLWGGAMLGKQRLEEAD